MKSSYLAATYIHSKAELPLIMWQKEDEMGSDSCEMITQRERLVGLFCRSLKQQVMSLGVLMEQLWLILHKLLATCESLTESPLFSQGRDQFEGNAAEMWW
jgi:hypothetical protein